MLSKPGWGFLTCTVKQLPPASRTSQQCKRFQYRLIFTILKYFSLFFWKISKILDLYVGKIVMVSCKCLYKKLTFPKLKFISVKDLFPFHLCRVTYTSALN